jgi:hypothetical protein
VYVEQVSRIVHKELNPTSSWTKNFLEECMKDWMANKIVKRFEGMPSFLVSSIWWARKSRIFKDKDIPLEVTTDVILNLSKEFMIDLKIKDPTLPSMPKLDSGIPWGFFDRACQGNPPVCRARVVIYLKNKIFIQVRYDPGSGTHNKSEFRALCTLLEVATKKGFTKLH